MLSGRPSENDDFRKNQNAKQSKRLNDRDDGDEMDPEDGKIFLIKVTKCIQKRVYR